MENMGYCRFRNTLNDLRDCADHIHDDDLSDDEELARQRLIETCSEILAEAECPRHQEVMR